MTRKLASKTQCVNMLTLNTVENKPIRLELLVYCWCVRLRILNNLQIWVLELQSRLRGSVC